ncbi:MAG: alpha/beta fold hydrolase [Gammaproteobacteria bacterium]
MPVKLKYNIFGKGRPVIILHGLLGSSGNWTTIAKRLAEIYQVITVDLRNHGRSGYHGSMTYEEMADDVEHLIKELCPESTAIIGHSMGGKVAMTTAFVYPELFSAVIVLDIAPVKYLQKIDVLIDAMNAVDMVTIKSRSDADRQLALTIGDSELRQYLLQNLVRNDHGYYWRVNLASIRSNMDYITGFPEVFSGKEYPGPALFLAGMNSDCINHKIEPAIHHYFPSAIIEYIENAGHWLHVEQPDIVVKKITMFLAKILPASQVNS